MQANVNDVHVDPAAFWRWHPSRGDERGPGALIAGARIGSQRICVEISRAVLDGKLPTPMLRLSETAGEDCLNHAGQYEAIVETAARGALMIRRHKPGSRYTHVAVGEVGDVGYPPSSS